MLLISTDQFGAPGMRLAQHKRAITAAVKAGVSHVIYTSMPKPNESLVSFAPDHAGPELALAANELAGWRILRDHWYFESWLHSIPEALKSGRWYSAAGEGKLSDISRDDIARAPATVLARVGADTSKVIYTLGGTDA